MQKTIIGWTDVSWNPAYGCSKVSDGCRFCYAETLARRWNKTALPWTVGNEESNVGIKPGKLKEPYALKTPSRVFVNSMSDLFHRTIPDWYRAAAFAVMLDLPQHTFQVLTKRSDALMLWQGVFSATVESEDYLALMNHTGTDKRVRRAMDAARHAATPWGANIWQGVSIEDRRAMHRLDMLKRCPAKVKFISAEPLLGAWGDVDLTGIDQVLVGGESGVHMSQHKERWMSHAWAREIRDLCIRDGAAFFFRQSSGARTETGTELQHEDGTRWSWQQYPGERHAPQIRFVAPRLYALSGDWSALPYDARGMQSDNTDDCGALELDAYISTKAAAKADRVAIVGSRDYPNLEAVRDYVRQLPPGSVVISGGARGVDRTAEEAARECGLPVRSILAEWDKHGKSAGMRRNHDIIAEADRVVAFWDGKSAGTAHSISIARKAGKPVEIIGVTAPPASPIGDTQLRLFEDGAA